MNIKRGDIIIVDLKGALGSEQKGAKRPCLVIQNDTGNKYSGTTIVASITSKEKNVMPTHINILNYTKFGLDEPSTILLEQIRTIDKKRIKKKVSKVDERTMKLIDEALIINFGIDLLKIKTENKVMT
ncbi:MAG: type II toxin-antitoxin system PemK/MazF family toxin [Candidatus Woesearchaeota archaeon]